MPSSRFIARPHKATVRSMWAVLILASTCSFAGGALPEVPAGSETVRGDWYFRESLAAVGDWEKILAWWEQQTPPGGQTPALPVPVNGETVEWPNPIPAMLLPPADTQRRVRVRIAGERVEVERIAPDGSRAPGAQETVACGETVTGYEHPGRGGKDQWYHRYPRRFDRLTCFQPVAAPFAVRVPAPLDWLPGSDLPRLTVRNVTAEPIEVRIGRNMLSIDRGQDAGAVVQTACREEKLALAAGAGGELVLPSLAHPGGAVLAVSFTCQDRTWWLPLLAYVEDVDPILAGIERLLGDSPDIAADTANSSPRERLADLQRRAQAAEKPSGMNWRRLFEEASALRDELLLKQVRFDSLLFVKRKPFYSEQPFMDAHHCYNRPGSAIYRLSPVHPHGKVVPVVDSLGLGIYRDLCLHWEGDRLLFAFGNGSDRVRQTTSGALSEPDGRSDYDLYEVATDGSRLRRLTSSPDNDCEPFYLPSGQIGFTSDRSEHYVMCGSDIHVANLFVMDAGGTSVRQLSFNTFNEFTPTMLPDGRILYSRWEYNERSVTSIHKLFTIHPDGTHPAPYYGNATIRPNVTMFGRPVPGSHKVTALFTAHHGQTHGPIGLIDTLRGTDGSAPITLLTPGVPVSGEKVDESFSGWFSDPVPLDEQTYLCSFSPTALPWLENTWGIYVGDRHGNLALVYRDSETSVAEPVPLVRRAAPNTLPPADAATDSEGEAELLVLDITFGLPGINRSDVKAIRIIEDVPRRCVPTGGVIPTAGTEIYTVKRLLGQVPVEPDGSAYFVVPANRNVYFEVLDGRNREIQRMRSVVCLKPGERRTCVGCHESRSASPPNPLVMAVGRPPSRPTQAAWHAEPLSFLRDVQPILDARCVTCHERDRSANRVVLSDDLTNQFTVGYEELLPYLSVANAKRWDHPDDVVARPPYTYGSNASQLTKLLDAGHHGVQLNDDEWSRLVTWIDANAVYYDRYESAYHYRQIFTGKVREELEAVYQRRCVSCHDKEKAGDGGRHDTWWLSLNRRDPSQSRALQAPLAREAGGWGRCPGPVFADRQDPEYRALLQAFSAVNEELGRRPREDLLSVRGDLPRQPPRRPPRPARVVDDNRPWPTATSGRR